MSLSKKIENLKEMEYISNFNYVAQVILKLSKKYPDNKRIKEAVDAMTQIGFYVNELMQNQHWYEHSLSQYRSDKLRAIERARRAEKQLNENNG